MKYHFSFNKIKKTDILLLDKNYSNLDSLNFNTSIFDYKKIYFFLFLYSLLEFLFNRKHLRLKDIYFKNYFRKVSPKIIIGHQAETLIFNVKKYSPFSKIILYLHCRLYKKQINDLKKVLSKADIDFFFVCDQLHENKFKKYTQAKFIINGLCKNNSKILKKKKEQFDIAFVSEYRNTNYPNKTNHHKFIKFVAKTLNKFASENKDKKIVIALHSNRSDKQISKNEEINFYKRYCPNLKIINQNDSYEVCNSSKLLVLINSNLGCEFLSRGKKVLFLPYLNLLGSRYFNYYFKKDYLFSYKKFNTKTIYKKIKFILLMKKKNWDKIVNKSKINILFDKNNSILQKEIKKILNKKIKKT